MYINNLLNVFISLTHLLSNKYLSKSWESTFASNESYNPLSGAVYETNNRGQYFLFMLKYTSSCCEAQNYELLCSFHSALLMKMDCTVPFISCLGFNFASRMYCLTFITYTLGFRSNNGQLKFSNSIMSSFLLFLSANRFPPWYQNSNTSAASTIITLRSLCA